MSSAVQCCMKKKHISERRNENDILTQVKLSRLPPKSIWQRSDCHRASQGNASKYEKQQWFRSQRNHKQVSSSYPRLDFFKAGGSTHYVKSIFIL